MARPGSATAGSRSRRSTARRSSSRPTTAGPGRSRSRRDTKITKDGETADGRRPEGRRQDRPAPEAQRRRDLLDRRDRRARPGRRRDRDRGRRRQHHRQDPGRLAPDDRPDRLDDLQARPGRRQEVRRQGRLGRRRRRRPRDRATTSPPRPSGSRSDWTGSAARSPPTTKDSITVKQRDGTTATIKVGADTKFAAPWRHDARPWPRSPSGCGCTAFGTLGADGTLDASFVAAGKPKSSPRTSPRAAVSSGARSLMTRAPGDPTRRQPCPAKARRLTSAELAREADTTPSASPSSSRSVR